MIENEQSVPIECCQNGKTDNRSGKRKTGRAYRRTMNRLKHQRRYKIVTLGGYHPCVGYLRYGFVDGVWQPVSDIIYYPKNSNCQRWIKRATSRRVRRYEGFPKKGNHYRRLFDYWWTMY